MPCCASGRCKSGTMSKIKTKKTNRGFALGEFTDRNGAKCSIQKSSLATEHAIWLGIDDADPQIMVSDAHKLGIPTPSNNGWVKYDIPKEVLLNTRMHLTIKQAKALLPILQKFVETGEL